METFTPGGVENSREGIEPEDMSLNIVRKDSLPLSIDGREWQISARDLAERHCAACHAVGKTGNSLHPAAPPFREFGRRWPIESLAEALAEGIVTGHPDMPAFSFSAAEVDDLLGWLDSIQVCGN